MRRAFERTAAENHSGMSHVRHSQVQTTTIEPGVLYRLTRRLHFFPRPSDYQELCFRIAKKALDLPVPDWREKYQLGMLLQHLDKLDAEAVQRWLLAASEINELAAMVMLDAMDFFCDCLRF